MFIHPLQGSRGEVELELARREPWPLEPACPRCSGSGGAVVVLATTSCALRADVNPDVPWLRLLCPSPQPLHPCDRGEFNSAVTMASFYISMRRWVSASPFSPLGALWYHGQRAVVILRYRQRAGDLLFHHFGVVVWFGLSLVYYSVMDSDSHSPTVWLGNLIRLHL